MSEKMKRAMEEFEAAQEAARVHPNASNLVAASQAYSRLVAAEREWIAGGRK